MSWDRDRSRHGWIHAADRLRRRRALEDFFLHPAVVITAILLICVGLILVVAHYEAKEKAAFMEQCLQDRKQYECEAMWRSSRPSSTFIYMPMGSRR